MMEREQQIVTSIEKYKKKLRKYAKLDNFNIFFRYLNILQEIHTDEDLELIEKLTITQADSELWFALRNYRLTGSTIGQLLTFNNGKFMYGSSFLNNHIKPSTEYLESMRKNQYVKYGKDMEKRIFSAFSSDHKNILSTEESGFVILKDYNHIGISPDGYGAYKEDVIKTYSFLFLRDQCTPNFTLEIKAPSSLYKAIKDGPAECLLSKMKLLDYNSENYENMKKIFLKPIDLNNFDEKCGDHLVDINHMYYIQCMYQMYAKKVSHCFFIVLIKGSEKTDTLKYYTIKFNMIKSRMDAIIDKTNYLYNVHFVPKIFEIYKNSE